VHGSLNCAVYVYMSVTGWYFSCLKCIELKVSDVTWKGLVSRDELNRSSKAVTVTTSETVRGKSCDELCY